MEPSKISLKLSTAPSTPRRSLSPDSSVEFGSFTLFLPPRYMFTPSKPTAREVLVRWAASPDRSPDALVAALVTSSMAPPVASLPSIRSQPDALPSGSRPVKKAKPVGTTNLATLTQPPAKSTVMPPFIFLAMRTIVPATFAAPLLSLHPFLEAFAY